VVRHATPATRPTLARLWSDSTLSAEHRAEDSAELESQIPRRAPLDLTALDAMSHLTDEEAGREGVSGGRAGLLSSPHLDPADVHRRLGNDREAGRTTTQAPATSTSSTKARTAGRYGGVRCFREG
jgi:hypothetical protein